jgi:hypothetical protein
MSKEDLILDKATLLKKQLNLAKDIKGVPQDARGILAAIDVGLSEIGRDALDLHDLITGMRNDYERDIKRLKNRIAKLENNQTTN